MALIDRLRRERPAGQTLRLVLFAALLVGARADEAPRFVEREGSGQPGEQYQGYQYEEGEGGTRVLWTYGRSRSLFEYGRPQTGWTFDLDSRPRSSGLIFQFRGSEVDQGLLQTSAYGIDPRWLGSRRQDFVTGYEAGAYSLRVGQDRLSYLTDEPAYSRTIFNLGAHGVEYRSEDVTVAADASLSAPLAQAALSADGYGLSQRRLGGAAGGYGDLGALAGVHDRFDQVSYTGAVSATGHQRRIEAEDGALTDRGGELGWSGLSLRWASRQAERGFNLFKPAGYAPWERLRDGREDVYQAGYQTAWLRADYGFTQTRTNLSGAWSERARTDLWQGSFALRPAEGLSLGYERTDRASGTLDRWAAGDEQALATYHEDRYRIERLLGDRGVSLTVRQYQDTGSATVGGDWRTDLRLGLATVAYGETASRRGEEDPVQTRTRRLSAETAVGLSGLTEWRTRTGDEGASHHRVGLAREVGPAGVTLSWENWRGYGNEEYVIAGVGGLLDGGVDATAYDAGLRLSPGSTSIEVWRRWLLLEPGGELPDDLTETGVTVAQRVWSLLGVEGGWSQYEVEDDTTEQRREVALAIGGESLPMLPTARLGFRERRSDEGREGTWFGTAQVQPYQGFRLEGTLAQSSTVGDDPLAYHPTAERRAWGVTAAHRLGSEGELTAGYSAAAPGGDYSRAEAGDPLARELTVGLALPPSWLHPSLHLSGQYRLSAAPGVEFGGVGSRHEQVAALDWALAARHQLSLRYRLGATYGESWWADSDQRFEVGYQAAPFGRGRLTLEGWLRDTAERLNAANDERYRVGVQLDLPF